MVLGGGSLVAEGRGECDAGKKTGPTDLGVWLAVDLREVGVSVLMAFLGLPAGRVSWGVSVGSKDNLGIEEAFFKCWGISFWDFGGGIPKGLEKTGFDDAPFLRTDLKELQTVFP